MAERVLDPDPIVRALQGAYAHDATRQDLLRLTAARMRDAGTPYTGVYLYMLHDGKLVLEAHAGRPTDLTEISVGRGICGQAVAQRRDINVPDVSKADGYLACNAETKSELVVLIRRNEEILGQIDVDSNLADGFSEAEQAAVKTVADALATFL